ncbi:tRNA pseudouridine38-40 synthase [Homoserinimonas aerilata]|uniref:tRNA pseudouridine synthase A n=1 Tax=Homoserinimonas aerilata TaxID=1162970 RepID=A0A542YLR6_9MICO|nr:tRNA pseudouridine synthase A [Homoserinimonas aerilata]TQL48904.1 tRNA pseudouridine38-40 synthase [Homoserinimonas aerilata]
MDSTDAGRPDGEEELTRIRLNIAYDGTDFRGWAHQPGLRTVQGEIDKSLDILFRRHLPLPTLVVAGRTDAGVHATGQVAHVDLTAEQLASLDRPRGSRRAGRSGAVLDAETSPTETAAASLARRVNGIAGLESDVHIASSTLAAPGFDARFSPVWRRYEYRIADRGAPRNPLERNRTVWYPAALDLDAMNTAADELLGLHDWAAYCKPREGATTVRTLQEFSWRRDEGGVLVATVRADAFCHSMVRSLVGACVSVGQGALPERGAARIRDERVRGSEFKVMPAKGLTLVEVGYPPDDELEARATQTRARRDPID